MYLMYIIYTAFDIYIYIYIYILKCLDPRRDLYLLEVSEI